MAIEKVTLAEEVINNNAEVNKEIELKLIEPAFEYVSHEQFKEHTKERAALFEASEATPYANVILHAGVIFNKGSDGMHIEMKTFQRRSMEILF